MRLLFLLLFFLAGCTQKYSSYDLIRKIDFNKQNYFRPQTTTTFFSQGEDSLESCFNQWFFFSNAEKQKNEALPFIIRSLCPEMDYLMDTSFIETWWTTILFTRSCLKIKTHCAGVKK